MVIYTPFRLTALNTILDFHQILKLKFCSIKLTLYIRTVTSSFRVELENNSF